MITLNSLQLSDSLVWSDRRAWNPVLQTVRMTVGGGLNIFSENVDIKRPVTLFANESQGWLTLEMAEGLYALASNANQVCVFNFHDLEVFEVRFKHEEPPALDLKPLVDGGELGLWFIGTIKLFSV
jgi:hypothetical protein